MEIRNNEIDTDIRNNISFFQRSMLSEKELHPLEILNNKELYNRYISKIGSTLVVYDTTGDSKNYRKLLHNILMLVDELKKEGWKTNGTIQSTQLKNGDLHLHIMMEK